MIRCDHWLTTDWRNKTTTTFMRGKMLTDPIADLSLTQDVKGRNTYEGQIGDYGQNADYWPISDYGL